MKIRANATKKIEAILNSVEQVEYFINDNNYKGGKVLNGFEGNDKQAVAQDIREGYALLMENQDGSYTIRYAGRCKWELKTRLGA